MPVQKVIIMDTCVGYFSEMVNTNDTITLQKKFITSWIKFINY